VLLPMKGASPYVGIYQFIIVAMMVAIRLRN
jgi:hypothetical protein